jgi:hypothetical protein
MNNYQITFIYNPPLNLGVPETIIYENDYGNGVKIELYIVNGNNSIYKLFITDTNIPKPQSYFLTIQYFDCVIKVSQSNVPPIETTNSYITYFDVPYTQYKTPVILTISPIS